MVLGENVCHVPNATFNVYRWEYESRAGNEPALRRQPEAEDGVPHAHIHVHRWDGEEGGDLEQSPEDPVVERVPLFTQHASVSSFGEIPRPSFPDGGDFKVETAGPPVKTRPPREGSNLKMYGASPSSTSALTSAMRVLDRAGDTTWPGAPQFPTQVVKLRPLEDILAEKTRAKRGSQSIDIPTASAFVGSSFLDQRSEDPLTDPSRVPKSSIDIMRDGSTDDSRAALRQPVDSSEGPGTASAKGKACLSGLGISAEHTRADCSSRSPFMGGGAGDILVPNASQGRNPLPPRAPVYRQRQPSLQTPTQASIHHYMHQSTPHESLLANPVSVSLHQVHQRELPLQPPSPSRPPTLQLPADEKSPTAVFNLSANCLAVGLLVLPVVFANLGVLLATAGLLIACLCSYFVALVLIRQAHRQGFPSYSGAALAHFGPAGQFLFRVAAVVSCWLLALFCFVAFEDSLLDRTGGLLSEILSDSQEDWFVTRPLLDMAVAALVLPFLCVNRWTSFSAHSVAVTALGSLFMTALFTVAAAGLAGGGMQALNWLPGALRTSDICRDVKDMVFVVPYLLYAFLLQHNIHPTMAATWGLRSGINHESQRVSYHRSISWSLLGTFVLYCLTAISGTVVIGKATSRHHSHELLIRSFSLENLEKLLGDGQRAQLAKLVLSGSYALLLLFSLPLVLWPFEDYLKELSESLCNLRCPWRNDCEPTLPSPNTTPLLAGHLPESGAPSPATTAAAPPLLGSLRIPGVRLMMLLLLVSSSAGLQLVRDWHWDTGGGLGLGPETINFLGCTAALLVGYVFPALMALRKRPSTRPVARSLSSPRLSLLNKYRASSSVPSPVPQTSAAGPPASAGGGEWAWVQPTHTSLPTSRSYGELSTASSTALGGTGLGPGQFIMRTAAICVLVVAALLVALPIANLATSSCGLRSEGIYSRHHYNS